MVNVFYQDAQSAINYKTENPSITLFISLESKFENNNYFWNDNSILSNLLPNRFIVVRLSASETQLEFSQFNSIFPTFELPSIYVFGSYSHGPSHSWIGSYPSIEEFVHFLSTINDQQQINLSSNNFQNSQKQQPTSSLPNSDSNERPIQPKSTKFCKISLQTSHGSFQHDFSPSDTIQSLRNWVCEVLSVYQCPPLTVMHTRSLLTSNNTLTLLDADLCPSAVLRVAINQNQIPIQNQISSQGQNNNNIENPTLLMRDENLPRIGNSDTPEVRIQPLGKFTNCFQYFLSFFNPFKDINEIEDFFEKKN